MKRADLQSQVWRDFTEECDERLAELRAKNDADLSEMETAKLRGRVAEIKRILALPADEDRSARQGDDLVDIDD